MIHPIGSIREFHGRPSAGLPFGEHVRIRGTFTDGRLCVENEYGEQFSIPAETLAKITGKCVCALCTEPDKKSQIGIAVS